MRLLSGLVDLLEQARRQIGFERAKNQSQAATINALTEQLTGLNAELEETKTALRNYKAFSCQQGELVRQLYAAKTRILDESNKLNEQCLQLAKKVISLEEKANANTINIKKLQKEREWFVERVQTLESQREGFVAKLDSHRDARRIMAKALNEPGSIDPLDGPLEQ